jgi:ABC-type antimicrobial peptide transport system permease subunit
VIVRNLRRRGTRSLLTILGIAIGVAAVVALGAMAQGIADNYGRAIGLSNDLLISQANAYDVVFSNLDENYGERIQAIPGVSNVEAGVFGWINVDTIPYFLIFGYEPDSVAMQHYRVVDGKPITGPQQMVIGRRGAEALNTKVGDNLRVYGVPYRVVGIYETGQGMEESGGVVSLVDAQTITQKQRQVSLFQVGLRPNTDIDQVIERIEKLDKELTVSKSSEYAGGQEWTAYLQGFAWGVAAIAILIGGLGMMSAMVMSVLERTREIGALRAMGWSRWMVMRIILGEAMGLSLIGGLIGIVLGVGLAWLAAQIPGAGAFLAGSFSLSLFAQGMATALTLGVVGGAYPAWSAANLQPVEALRYEGGGPSQTGGWLSHVGDQSFRNLWRRRARTLISASGIGVGVATLVMLGGLIEGLIGQINNLAGSGGAGNLTIMQRDVADMSLSSLDERLISQLRAMPQIKAVSPFILGVVTSADMPFFILGGLDPNDSAMQHYQLRQGRHVLRPNEMILGKVASKTYKWGIDDTITLYDNRYRIVGIFETGVTYEDGSGILALREAQRLLNRGRTVSFIFVDVYDPAQARAVARAIDQRFPEARTSLSSEFAQQTDDMQTSMAMMDAIRFLAILVGGIVVANTMIMSIYERTREIGALRALGWSAWRILAQILQESLYLCLIAGVLGALMGVGFLAAIAQLPFASSVVSPAWSVETFALALGVALLLGLLGGFYPAWRASRLQPVEALRYE